jgi:hypothetical protein
LNKQIILIIENKFIRCKIVRIIIIILSKKNNEFPKNKNSNSEIEEGFVLNKITSK